MKKLGILLVVVTLLALANVAPAVTVNIQQNGAAIATYTNATLQIGQDGTVTVAVPSSQTCATNPPTINVTGYPSSGTVGTQVSANVTVTDGNTGSVGLPASPLTASVGVVSGSTWTWTPTSSGTQTVTLTVTNNASCNTTNSFTFTVSVSGGGTPPPPTGATLLPSSGIGMILGSPAVLAPLGEQHYYFTIPTAAASYVIPQMTTRDWQQNVDMFVSNVSQPSCPAASSMTKWNNLPPSPAPWYNINSSSNERTSIFGQYAANTTFYVTVCNRSNIEAQYGIFWSEQ